MEIRKARKTDDLKAIARLIYQTDPYIYPYWFEKTPKWEKFLVEKITERGFLFCLDNILVATENGHIFGVLVYITVDTDLKYDYDKLKEVNRNFQFTIDRYVFPVIKHVRRGVVYIPNVCVEKKFRRQHIASRLIEELKKQYPKHILELDVLADNEAGIKLYHKEKFKKIVEIKGFNGPYKRKPRVWTMRCNLK